MSLHTIFVTNRNQQTDNNTQPYGEFISKINRIAVATPITEKTEKWKRVTRGKRRVKKSYLEIQDTYKLTPIKDQQTELSSNQEAIELCHDLVNSDANSRPWLLFLHGNNQTLEKNLIKARKIQDLYQVNLVIYSWPSKSFDDDVEKYLIAAGVVALFPGGWMLTKHLAKKGLKRKIKQYKNARTNAKLTAQHFIKALSFLNQQLIAPLQDRGIAFNMITHSLGHKVLKDAITKDPSCFKGTVFNNCTLHQADEAYPNHPAWATKLPVASTENVTITNNDKDIVLFLSGLLNNGGNISKPLTRLGNRKNFQYDSQQLSYMELSGGGNTSVGWQHGIAWHSDIHPSIKAKFNVLFTQ